MQPDDLAFFKALAAEMNAHPERFQPYGDADFAAVVAMERAGRAPFQVRLEFEGVRCDDVCLVEGDAADAGDFVLEGPLDAWWAMFDDIRTHRRATGLQTINSLALLADRIRLRGRDPMGLDKFSRFNQTLQQFLDGAAAVAVATT